MELTDAVGLVEKVVAVAQLFLCVLVAGQLWLSTKEYTPAFAHWRPSPVRCDDPSRVLSVSSNYLIAQPRPQSEAFSVRP